MTGGLFLRLVVAIVAAYLLGSIPSGVLIGRFGNKDPRNYGSGKTGATNVLRTLGPGAAAIVVVLDVGKGIAAVLLARWLLSVPEGTQVIGAGFTSWQGIAEALAGLAALLGHNYSLYIHFKGGRGVLTGGGAVAAVSPLSFVVGLVCAVVPIAITRYVSLGSILGAAACPVAGLILLLTGHESLPHELFLLLGSSFVIYSHKDNIQRLLSGTERKLGQPAEHVQNTPSAAH